MPLEIASAGERMTATSSSRRSAPFDGLVMPNSACISSLRPEPTSP
jgi:hypothetical protein